MYSCNIFIRRGLLGTTYATGAVSFQQHAQPAFRIKHSKIPSIKQSGQLLAGRKQHGMCLCRAIPADQLSVAFKTIFISGINGVCFDAECAAAADRIFLAVLAVPLLGLLCAILYALRPIGESEVRLKFRTDDRFVSICPAAVISL